MPENKSKRDWVEANLLTELLTGTPTTKAGAIVQHLTDKRHVFQTVSYIYVLKGRTLVGALSIKEILRTPADTPLSKIMKTKLFVVYPKMTLEQAAISAIQHGIKAVPVVDHKGDFQGVVGTDTLLHTLHREHVEDLLRLGGIQVQTQKHIMEMIGDRVGHLLKIRTPWLVLGLAGGLITTIIVSLFEKSLAETVALAFFIPVIVYMSSAVGNQTQTLFIRALAVKKFSLQGYVLKELFVDIVLGVLFGLLIALFGMLWNRTGGVAVVVGISMALNVFMAGAVAILISWILYATKRDPALGAGPFYTVVQDTLSIVVYLLVAAALL